MKLIIGMIVGGILGKGITGKDNGAAAGAVMGGVIAADARSKQAPQGSCQTNENSHQIASAA